MIYPTQKEIQKILHLTDYKPTRSAITEIIEWKQSHWKKYVGKVGMYNEKTMSISILLEELTYIHGGEVINRSLPNFRTQMNTTINQTQRETHLKISTSNKYEFIKGSNEILTDLKHPSIISALHEFAHWLAAERTKKHKGNPLPPKEEEIYACCWSINAFKETFPIAFRKLTWDGHMLRRP